MDLALHDFLIPKLVNVGIDLLEKGNENLYLVFMRNLKRAKEMLSSLNSVCELPLN